MKPFTELLYEKLAEALLLFDAPQANQIYVLSLYIDFDEGPHHAKVWLYYNTYSYLRQMIDQGEHPLEAKWNFALWEQDYITAVGLSPEECRSLADDRFHRMLAAWLRERGLYRSEAQIKAMLALDEGLYSNWESEVRERLLDLFAGVARELQETGVVLARFGRSIPLLIHEWDYSPWTLEATRGANPEGLTAEFEEWLLGEVS